MNRKIRWKADLIGVGIAFFSALIVSAMFSWSGGPFSDWEEQTVDYQFKLRGSLPVDPRIVLIDIDDQSIRKIGLWPWDRSFHAKMIEILSESGAAVIAYDVLFNQQMERAGDEALVQAVRKAGNVILPTGFELEKNAALLSMKREIGPFAEVRRAAAGLGHISANRDPDGTIRRMPLVVDAGGQYFPAFSLAILTGYFQVPQDKVLIDPEKNIVLQNTLMSGQNTKGEVSIPIERYGMMRINFAGRWVETFSHFSFVDILTEWEMGNHQDLLDIIQGKICLVTNTATGFDLKPVPLEVDYPGGGIHANSINTILTGLYLHDLGFLPTFGLTLLLSVMVAIFAVRWSLWISFVSMILLALVYLPLTIYTFHNGLITPILPPILASGLTYVSALLYQNRLSRKHIEALTDDKEQIGKTLREVTQALRENEIELIKSREELSHLICTMDQIRDREQEKLERIRYLETALEQVGVQQDDLLNKKWILEEKVADLVAVPVREDESINMEWKILQREFARHGVITYSAKIFKVFDMAKKVAVTNEPVLIQGETGTGKELFARAIHTMSPRSQKPFVTINTPALPDNLIESELFGHLKGSFTGAVTDKKGKFQLADGGTVFLDEIGELRPDLQAKLLRVLQNGEVDRVGANSPIRVDVRIIAATNRDLQAEVRGRFFRNDLYFRLNVVSINLPSLRERLEDIEALADYFLKKHILESGRKIKGISQKALEMLKRHPWPGNVRELENVISRGVIMASGDWITEDDLELTEEVMIHPEQKNFTEDDIEAIEEGEPLSDKAFLSILRENEFEIGRTAQQLNMSRGTVGSRFKGISFKVLAQCGGDFTQATREIAADSRAFDLVERRVREYYENLIQVIQGYDNFDEAIQECHRRFKNLQERYIGSLDLLVRKHFGQIVTKR